MAEYMHGPLTAEQAAEIRGPWSPETKRRMELGINRLIADSAPDQNSAEDTRSSEEIAQKLGIELPDLPPREI